MTTDDAPRELQLPEPKPTPAPPVPRTGPTADLPAPTGRVSLQLTYDAATDVAYLVLAPTGRADVLGPTLLCETDPLLDGLVAVDFVAASGRLSGIEVMSASAMLPPELLLRAERIDGQHLARRAEERFIRRMEAGWTPPDRDRTTH